MTDRFELIRCDPQAPDYDRTRAALSAALGQPITFPTVEIEPGRFMTDSMQLMRHFSAANAVTVDRLPALAFYEAGILPQLKDLHR